MSDNNERKRSDSGPRLVHSSKAATPAHDWRTMPTTTQQESSPLHRNLWPASVAESRVIQLEFENARLQRLVLELLAKNQQLRAGS